MKRGVLINLLLFLLGIAIFASISHAQEIDYDPVCTPNIQSCGCGGTQTRYTLPEGGCSDWYPCSISEIESDCTDNLDNDCDGLIDCEDLDCSTKDVCIDSDNDGHFLSEDCDDDNPSIFPGAVELCNNIDDDCDGLRDEDLSRQCGTSNIGICSLGTESCIFGSWGGCTAALPEEEVCDTIDNDCDGQVDEGCECTTGNSQNCGTDTGACQQGTQTCQDGAWSTCTGSTDPVDEICGNSLDDDCDGYADEGCIMAEEELTEPEPTSTPPLSHTETEPSEPAFVVGRECIDYDGDGYGKYCSQDFDCDDTDAARNPGMVETCNGIDDNCDNIVDEHLTRGCGVSNVGICIIGIEQCTNGAWYGCTAVFPSDEICGNDKDDNCDGRVDEDCSKSLSDEEIALKQFLDIKLGKETYDWNHYLERHKSTRNFIRVNKHSTASNGRTRITIEIDPLQTIHNLTVFEYIPKFIESSADNIIFTTQPEILQADPLVAWHFDELSEKVDLSYEVDGEIPDAAEKTSTITFAEDISPIMNPWYFEFIPLMIIPILGLIFIILVQAVHDRKRQ